jgi:hypothetical protein
MADILFLIAGIALLIKGEVHISRKRVLKGRAVKILGLLYVAPFVVTFICAFIASAIGFGLTFVAPIGVVFVVIDILATLYFILFHKNEGRD